MSGHRGLELRRGSRAAAASAASAASASAASAASAAGAGRGQHSSRACQSSAPATGQGGGGPNPVYEVPPIRPGVACWGLLRELGSGAAPGGTAWWDDAGQCRWCCPDLLLQAVAMADLGHWV
eukprot:CAMPEP_0206227772 /NCGR_PEP_ID=MMETSP0047_2-20121206/8805_1 /ASSEMBLY_ACC=CAM_ASM_000192 /TAXON_ID=195065 /ORGANISM="Chroomonas mesostigmatica_cf, Strain CCMP1168" /LENGTH=122 /DNA_ID=CAMNT_0053650953 /DNA_START=1429 /DNA_END=1798 /DNA_ORIENTATION=-